MIIFILDNQVAMAKSVVILNNNLEFHSRFETTGKLDVSYPVVAFFLNVSNPNKRSLSNVMRSSRSQIQSASKVIFTKPPTIEGHSTFFLSPGQSC